VRVTGWVIDGFGVLGGHETRDLPAGLVVFEGPNEAGKSTLLAFLRGMLFGFPRVARNRRPHYPPLAGGRHGGCVFLQTASGPVTIDREVGRGGRIVVGDGTELSDAAFQQLIGGVDAQTFRTVFAFSLDELRDFDSLTGEQVRSRIFAAGVGGAGPSVHQVVQDLERVTGQLLKPRARDPEINGLLHALAGREHELEDARLRSERYPELLEEEETARARLGQLDEQEREARAEVSTYERLLDLWPVWVDLAEDRAVLDSLEVVDEFVPDPLRRLAEAKQALAGARHSLARAEEQSGCKSAEVDSLEAATVEGLGEIGPAAQKQVGLLPFYRDRLREQEGAVARAQLGEERLRRALNELGSGVGEAALATIDTSLPRTEEIRGWRSTLTEANERVRQAEERLQMASVLSKRAQGEREHQKATMEATVAPDETALAARSEALRALRVGLAELRSKRAALEGREVASRATALLVESATARGPGRRRLDPWAVVLLATGTVLAAGAVSSLVAGHRRPLIALAVLALLAFAGAGSLFLRSRGSAAATGSATAACDPTQILQTEHAEQERLRDEILGSEVTLVDAAGVLGWDRLPDLQTLERMDASLAAERQESIRWQDQVAELEKAEERLRASALEEEAARRRLTQAQEESASLGQEFAAQLGRWGLPTTLSGQGAEEYLRAVASAKELRMRLDEEHAGLARLQGEVAAWEDETARLLEQADLEPASPASGAPRERDLETALFTLADLCDREAERQRELAVAKASLRELEVYSEQVKNEVKAASDQWRSLLDQAAVPDEEAFLRKLKVFEDRQELARRITEAEGLLVKRIGRGPEAEVFGRTLEGGEVGLWEQHLRELAGRLDDIKAKREELIKAQGDAERRRKELEGSADVPALETVVEGLRTDLDSAVDRWRVHTLAVALVRGTLAQFTRERQPAVLAEASRMFALVTGGRYQRVLRSPGEEGIIVMDGDGRSKSPEDLSRGTAEQLYLCLRLGLAEEFSLRAEPMPLVMDDVLVNFDPARRRATARLLLEFAERHQILLFTCHPEIADIVREEQPEICVVKL
jgi:uncharacterized protein YhaN